MSKTLRNLFLEWKKYILGKLIENDKANNIKDFKDMGKVI